MVVLYRFKSTLFDLLTTLNAELWSLVPVDISIKQLSHLWLRITEKEKAKKEASLGAWRNDPEVKRVQYS